MVSWGPLASATRSVGHFDKLRQRGLPIVQFDRVNRLLDTPTVTTDDYGSAYQATERRLPHHRPPAPR